MTRTIIFSTIMVVLLLLLSVGAQAQNVCGEYTKLANRLKTVHGEFLLGRGIAANNRIVEVYGGRNGWTILVVDVQMNACIASISTPGYPWEVITPPPAPPAMTNKK